MNTKERLKKWAAILVAAVVALSMLPAERLEVQAAGNTCAICGHDSSMHVGGTGHCYADHETCICGGFVPSAAAPSSVVKEDREGGSDGEMDREKSSEPPVPSKTPEQIARERVIAEGEEHQAAIKQESEINKAVQVGGSVVRSTLAGAYTAKSVRGTAVRTPLVQAESDLGLSEGEKLNVTTWDVTEKNSPQAAASLESAAKSVGGEAGAMFQVNIDKIVDGKPQTMSLLNGSVTMTVGVPAGVNTDGGTLAVAHVIAGGAYEVQRDQDSDPNTATFSASAGDGAYALVTNPDEELLQKAENNTLADQVAAAIPSLGWRNDGLFIMGGGAAQTAANAGTGTGTGTSEAVASATTQYVINSISATPAGGTANIAIAGSSLDSSIVRIVLARRDINIYTGCFVDGKLCTITIPAGADLSDLIRPDGTIEIKKLAERFGKIEV